MKPSFLSLLALLVLAPLPARAAIEPAPELPDAQPIPDDRPETSRQALVRRFVALGATPDAAALSVESIASLREAEAVDLLVPLEPLGLSGDAALKAEMLASAFVAGEPVDLTGIELPDGYLDRVHAFRDGGVDPDVALWLVRQEDAVMVDGVRIGDGPLVVDSASAPAAPRSTRERRVADRLAPDVIAQPTPLGFCRTCPSIDFAPPAPTTTYQTVSGTLTQGSCLIYRFIVQPSQQYRFTFCEGGGSATFDTRLDAYGDNCQLVGSNDNSCTGGRSQLDVTTSAAGYLYVKVSASLGGSGNFVLAYKRRDVAGGGGTCTTCPAYDLGTYGPTAQWQTATTTVPANGCRIYRFNALVNKSYEFSTCKGGGTTNFDAVVETFYGNCNAGPFADDNCSSRENVAVASNTSQYLYVRVRGFNGASGTVTLAYRDLTTFCPPCPQYNYGPFTPTGSWQTHPGSFATGQTCRRYAFSLVVGHAYRFSMCDGGGGATIDTDLRLESQACGTLASADDQCGTQPALDYAATYTGVHYLVVGNETTLAGTWTLAYVEICRPCTDPPHHAAVTPTLAFNTTADTLPSPVACRLHAFTLLQNVKYRFTTCAHGASSSFQARLELQDGACVSSQVDSTSCIGPSGEITTPFMTSAVTRTVRVTSANGGSGGYALGWYEIGRQCPAFHSTLAPLDSFQTVSATLEPGGNRVYKMPVFQNGVYKLSLCPPDGSVAFTPVVTVVDAVTCAPLTVTTQLCSGQPRIYDFTAPADGDVLITVAGSTPAAAGAFVLAYRALSLPCPGYHDSLTTTNAYQTVPGTIGPGGNHVYRVPIVDGRTVRFTFCDNGGTANFPVDVVVRRIANCVVLAGTSLTCNAGSRDSFTFTPFFNTDILVEVKGVAPADAGNYTLAYRHYDCTAHDNCANFDSFADAPIGSGSAFIYNQVLAAGCPHVLQLRNASGATKTYYVSVCPTDCVGVDCAFASWPMRITAFDPNGGNGCASISGPSTMCGDDEIRATIDPGGDGTIYVVFQSTNPTDSGLFRMFVRTN